MYNEERKTPYFVIHEKEMKDNLECLKKFLQKYWNNYAIGYSFKTNSVPWLIRFMKQNGCLAEVVSDDEYSLAQKLKYTPNDIIFNGPVKSRDAFLAAVRNGSIVNIDSKQELEWISELENGESYHIGIRINFDLERTCPGETQCGKDDGRFGFCYENGELNYALEILDKRGIQLSGIHLHCSSKTRSQAIYDAITKKAAEIIKNYKLNLEYVDIGGGFFGGLPGKPSFDSYMQIISNNLRKEIKPEQTKIIIEPGMSVVGAYIDYITTVVDVKNTLHNCFVTTDGSRTNIDPLMRKSSYFYQIIRRNKSDKILPKQTLCGFTCMENDRFMILEYEKEIKRGDMVVYKKVGAYTMCLAPLFIQFFPDIYVEKEGDYTLIRKKWNAEDILTGSIL